MSAANEARLSMRRGEWTGPTIYQFPGFVQCNLVVLPRSEAYDFLVYCQRNPRACPVIDITEPGDPEPHAVAPGADLRTDLPRYAVYRHGRRGEDVTDILDLWRTDSVGFLIGSSLSFDHVLEKEGIPRSKDVWVLKTSLPTRPAGKFRGPLVVTMRWMTSKQAELAARLTARWPQFHGAPVYIGDPDAIGADLTDPIAGEPVSSIPPGTTPVYWACGVTPQLAARQARPELMITHAPGHGFVCDLKVDAFLVERGS